MKSILLLVISQLINYLRLKSIAAILQANDYRVLKFPGTIQRHYSLPRKFNLGTLPSQ